MLDNLLIGREALPSPDSIHVDPRAILTVRLLSEMLELLLRLRRPERVHVEDLRAENAEAS